MEFDFDTAEPSPSDLAAIEAEWPQIERALAEVDAMIRDLYRADHGPSELDRRRVRRAETAITRAAVHDRLQPVRWIEDEVTRYHDPSITDLAA